MKSDLRVARVYPRMGVGGDLRNTAASRSTARWPARPTNGLRDPPDSGQAASARTAPMSWMTRLRRVFALDISDCPQCGGEARVIATVTEPMLIVRLLEHASW